MTLIDLSPGDTFRFPADPHVWLVLAVREPTRVAAARLDGGVVRRLTRPSARHAEVIRVGRGSTLCHIARPKR